MPDYTFCIQFSFGCVKIGILPKKSCSRLLLLIKICLYLYRKNDPSLGRERERGYNRVADRRLGAAIGVNSGKCKNINQTY